MLLQIYQVVYFLVAGATAAFVALLVLRLAFNYSDPNPFGAVGKFGFRVKKITERSVYPAARLLAQFGINPRLAPLVTIFVAVVAAYFALRIVGETFDVIGALAQSLKAGNVKALVGIALYAAIDVFILFVFIRFISTWFVFARRTFFAFVRRVTDPILLPLQRLIPPVGMFDISAMILLIALNFLQSIILKIFVYS